MRHSVTHQQFQPSRQSFPTTLPHPFQDEPKRATSQPPPDQASHHSSHGNAPKISRSLTLGSAYGSVHVRHRKWPVRWLRYWMAQIPSEESGRGGQFWRRRGFHQRAIPPERPNTFGRVRSWCVCRELRKLADAQPVPSGELIVAGESRAESGGREEQQRGIRQSFGGRPIRRQGTTWSSMNTDSAARWTSRFVFTHWPTGSCRRGRGPTAAAPWFRRRSRLPRDAAAPHGAQSEGEQHRAPPRAGSDRQPRRDGGRVRCGRRARRHGNGTRPRPHRLPRPSPGSRRAGPGSQCAAA